jgi:hypothetical protein
MIHDIKGVYDPENVHGFWFEIFYVLIKICISLKPVLVVGCIDRGLFVPQGGDELFDVVLMLVEKSFPNCDRGHVHECSFQ